MKIICLNSEKGFTLKGKKLLLWEQLRSFYSRHRYRKKLVYKEANKKSQKLSLLQKVEEKSAKCIQFLKKVICIKAYVSCSKCPHSYSHTVCNLSNDPTNKLCEIASCQLNGNRQLAACCSSDVNDFKMCEITLTSQDLFYKVEIS